MNKNYYREIIDNFANELELNFDEAIELYYILTTELNNEITNLKLAINEQNEILIKKIIHNLKGMTINYKLKNLYERSFELDNILKNKDVGSQKNKILKFSDDFTNEINELAQFLESKLSN